MRRTTDVRKRMKVATLTSLTFLSAAGLSLALLPHGSAQNPPGVPDVETQQVFVGRNDGAGGLLPRTGYRVGPEGIAHFPIAARIADLTGDGRGDVAAANTFTNSVSVLYGTARAVSRFRSGRLSPQGARRATGGW